MSITDCLGKIEGWEKGKKVLGSAALVQGKGEVLVVTAAHCVFDWKEQKFYERPSVWLYMERFRQKYPVSDVYISSMWTKQALPEYDTAFLVLKSDADMQRTFNKAALPVGFCLTPGREYQLMGFENRIFPSKHPAVEKGTAQKDEKYGSTMQGIHTRHSFRGMSGGPWVTWLNGNYVVNSVTSLEMLSIKSTLWGPYWGEVIEEIYDFSRYRKDKIQHNVVRQSF